jgi:hypothetical protein
MPRTKSSDDDSAGDDARTPQRDRGAGYGPEDHAHKQPADPGRDDETPARVSRVTDETEDDELADDSMEELDLDDLHNMEGPDA